MDSETRSEPTLQLSEKEKIGCGAPRSLPTETTRRASRSRSRSRSASPGRHAPPPPPPTPPPTRSPSSPVAAAGSAPSYHGEPSSRDVVLQAFNRKVQKKIVWLYAGAIPTVKVDMKPSLFEEFTRGWAPFVPVRSPPQSAAQGFRFRRPTCPVLLSSRPSLPRLPSHWWFQVRRSSSRSIGKRFIVFSIHSTMY